MAKIMGPYHVVLKSIVTTGAIEDFLNQKFKEGYELVTTVKHEGLDNRFLLACLKPIDF